MMSCNKEQGKLVSSLSSVFLQNIHFSMNGLIKSISSFLSRLVHYCYYSTMSIPITDIPKSFADEKYKKVLSTAHEEGSCIIPRRKPRKDGYVRWTVTSQQRQKLGLPGKGELSYYTHQLTFYSVHGYVPEKDAMHISHLCHNPSCMNVLHLVEETPEENMARKNCFIQCPHCFCNLCPHEPRCIRC